ncbi:Yip1 family protein [Microbulbifer thermotolerans]|uniref:YIP1 family protein n=1 Tax=Microbulbifer thermotolerans TaxID=252514 RepID=A0AB35HV77_MICTH|nr:Yip1 family protein [Microbulbifer thermotolerans]MCX2780766.1 YIP1 family protein [Microbulbifer thermotolerans]MCX2800662.1 YIP1 family protein [Microbulbifer thermotolerans]MCX2806503.1 YIP1 family protein [Microbulbifer thermotolerans]MCX2841546.1 YIP1 family protein [Microbulbifer thermotolerans]
MRLLSHTIGIFTHPDKEWKAIRADHLSFAQVFFSHVPILALIPTIAGYIGVTYVGFELGGHLTKLTSQSAALLAVVTYFAIVLGIYLLGEFINWMAKSYGVEGDEPRRHYEGTALAVFVTTPIFLASFVLIYPHLWLTVIVFGLAGTYSIYLLFEGIPILMNMNKERAFLYACAVVTVALVMMVTVMIGSVILWSIGIGPVYQH